MEYLGIFAFVSVLFLWDRVKRLERTLRENNIRPIRPGSLGDQLRSRMGQTVNITLYEGGGSTTTLCKVLDADDDERTLEDTVAGALAQIEEKEYETALLAKGISKDRIRKYGFAFEGKNVLTHTSHIKIP